MCDLIAYYWREFPKANATSLQQCISRHLEQEYLAELERKGDSRPNDSFIDWEACVPSTQSIRRAIAKLGKQLGLERAVGMQRMSALTRPPLARIWATRTNERWEMDHTEMGAWVQEEINGKIVQLPVWMTAVIDVYTRAVLGFTVSTGVPDSMTIAMTLRKAFLPRHSENGVEPFGTPERLVVDRGGDFTSDQTDQFCAKVGVKLEILPARSPNLKPHIERFFGTIKGQLVSRLTGSKGGKDHGTEWNEERIRRLPTIEFVRAETERWLDSHYHRTIHSATGERPVERWRRTMPVVSKSVRERDLDLLLVYHTRRLVTRGLVRLTVPGRPRARYYASALMELIGEEVVIRHNPDDVQSVYAYDKTNTMFLAELVNVDLPDCPITSEQIVSEWKAHRARIRENQKSLAERIARFHAGAEEGDRARGRRRLQAQRASDEESRKAVLAQQQLEERRASERALSMASNRRLAKETQTLQAALSADAFAMETKLAPRADGAESIVSKDSVAEVDAISVSTTAEVELSQLIHDLSA
jgi:transposase InsO family protein